MTRSISSKEIVRATQTIDAEGQILGRLATQVAALLMGKGKVKNVPYLDMGDIVVVKNAAKIKVTGNKMEQELYYKVTRRPGHLKSQTMRQVMSHNPKRVVEDAVWGMLPKTKLGKRMITRLKVQP